MMIQKNPQNQRHDIRNLVFDLDDTLIPSLKIYETVLGSMSPLLARETYEKARGEVKRLMGGGHSESRSRLLYLKRALDETGNYSPQKTLEWIQIYEQKLEAEIRSFWNASRLDAVLRPLTKKFHIGVLSNENTRTQLIKMRAIDPDAKIFAHLLTSGEVGVEKPDERIYHEYLGRFGLKAQETLMISDNWQTDLIGARKAGMKILWVAEHAFTDRPRHEDCEVIDSLHVLAEYLS